MEKGRVLLISIACFIVAAGFSLYADEGMWMLDELASLPLEQMKAQGLDLTPQQIFELKDAAVLIGGGSGAFVSRDGLILTNHHVAFEAIQRGSSLEENFIQNGFLARTREEELPAPEYEVYVTRDFIDVTDRILKAVNKKMSYFERYQAIEKAQKKLIAEYEKKGNVRCEVVDVMSGSKYYLYQYDRIQDVRLVYAPPSSIGEFGGEVDNWMWPRHTGDFSFMRAYVAPNGRFAEYSKDNVPYRPKVFLPVSTRGYDEGSFAMIMGYPGATYRYRCSYSIDLRQNWTYPSFIDVGQAQIDVLRTAGEKNPELAIKFSSRIKSLENGKKNSQGMLDGFRRTNLLQRKLDQEKAFTEYLETHPEMKNKYSDVLPGIKAVYDELKAYNQKQDMLQNLLYASDCIGQAYTLVKWGMEKSKPDMEREPQFQQRNIPNIFEELKMVQQNLDVPTDQMMVEMLLSRASNLPEGQKIKAVEKVIQGRTGADREKAISAFADDLFRNTTVHVEEERVKMFEMTTEELRKRHDALLDFVMALEEEYSLIDDQFKGFVGAVNQLRPRLIQGMYEWKKSALYADANRTLRFTYGTVQGYSPADAVRYDYVTTIEGVLEKDTGVEPFAVPERLRKLAQGRDFARYTDPRRKTMVVDFLTNHDTTGGSSGSPVINGRGELIGVTFDGNYESMTSDYQYDPELTRCINVDVRYVLFVTEKFGEATNVIQELGIR